tara:strand:+ start:8806 stop:9087 length:282 start_codon:yes stop_codon:yes gene_type:complete
MLFKPHNRHLLIEPIEEDEIEETAILLPDDYREQSLHSVGRVLRRAKDCSVEAWKGDIVVYLTNMLETITLNGKDSFLLLENYVLGTIIHEKN